VYLPEGRPGGLLTVPAFLHEIVDLLGTVTELRQVELRPVADVVVSRVVN